MPHLQISLIRAEYPRELVYVHPRPPHHCLLLLTTVWMKQCTYVFQLKRNKQQGESCCFLDTRGSFLEGSGWLLLEAECWRGGGPFVWSSRHLLLFFMLIYFLPEEESSLYICCYPDCPVWFICMDIEVWSMLCVVMQKGLSNYRARIRWDLSFSLTL